MQNHCKSPVQQAEEHTAVQETTTCNLDASHKSPDFIVPKNDHDSRQEAELFSNAGGHCKDQNSLQSSPLFSLPIRSSVKKPQMHANIVNAQLNVLSGDASKFTSENLNKVDQKVLVWSSKEFRTIPFCSSKLATFANEQYHYRSPPKLPVKVPTARFKPELLRSLTENVSPEARTIASNFSEPEDDFELDQATLERELFESERLMSLGETFDLSGCFKSSQNDGQTRLNPNNHSIGGVANFATMLSGALATPLI